MDSKKMPIAELADDDDTTGVLNELVRMLESGEASQAAVRFRLEDGTEREFVIGTTTAEERELLLATLQSQLETKH